MSVVRSRFQHSYWILQLHIFKDLVIWSFFTPQMRCLFRRGRRIYESWTLVFTRVLLFFRMKLTELNLDRDRDRGAYLGAGLITLLSQMSRF